MSIAIVWFRRDLRLRDNPALVAAAQHAAVIPVYIFAPEEEGAWAPGGASRWWLHHSLLSLQEELAALGSGLLISRGSSIEVLEKLIDKVGATAVYWNRVYEPLTINRDSEIKAQLKNRGVVVESFNSALLAEPWTIQNSSKKPFRVFTPYWKNLSALYSQEKILPAPKSLPALPKELPSGSVTDLDLLPRVNWTAGMEQAWNPGAAGANASLKRFLSSAISDYPEGRDHPDILGTSRMSPHLHFGEIGPREIWDGVTRALESKSAGFPRASAESYLREIGWREFGYHLLYHFPTTVSEPLDPKFAKFPWRKNEKRLRAWQKGMTGYPIVDAGMRELWTTGWMHNRVRMVVGSFLVKHLLIPWQEGAAWFWDTLVDADLANNTLGWQWIAGCGADASPFFRIFNPILQGEKFDSEGNYVRRWVPEIAKLPNALIHKPWEASDEVLTRAGVKLGSSYPKPIVDHAAARGQALELYGSL